MRSICLHDNRSRKYDLSDSEKLLLLKFSGVPLEDLNKQNPGLLVFPREWGLYGDNWERECLFHIDGESIATGNVVGFFGINNLRFQVCSRFDQSKDSKKQYFLHYMLQRVFGINLLNMQTSPDKEPIWDFLYYLFPYFLKRAIKQGIFRTYRAFQYNDDHIRGTIDVSRHIRRNIPFNGRVAYQTREHSGNNFLTHLVRHTIEAIRSNVMVAPLLSFDDEIRNAVQTIIYLTPDFSKRDLTRVISQNLRPVRHPFYTEYSALQRICLKILRNEKITYGEDEEKLNGIVFKAEWLWEEYLATILEGIGVQHSQNTLGESPLFLYRDRKHGIVFPDFYTQEIILDAKYKNSKIQREDRFQLISYIHIQNARAGFLIFPGNGSTQTHYEDGKQGLLNGGGSLGYITFAIPAEAFDFSDFCQQIRRSEITLQEIVTTQEQAKIRMIQGEQS